MLQPHSFLWHYLWLAPHLLQGGLAWVLWRRGIHRLYPFFVAYLVLEAVKEFVLYGMDLLPSVSAYTFWAAYCVGVVFEGLIKFALIGELLFQILKPWPALATMGNRLLRCTGAALVLVAALVAGYVRIDNPKFNLISHAHILQQSLYFIQCGLILFLFLFAAHFRLAWNRFPFGIALGFAVVWCEHLGTWAVMANGGAVEHRYLLDFLNMATYHVCVLIWMYYLLVPQKSATPSAVSLPEHDLDIWNRELERLLQ